MVRKAKRKRKAKRASSPRTSKRAASGKATAKKRPARRRAAATRTGPIQVEYSSLSEVVRWPRNPKLHAEDLILESMARFGYVMPVLVDETSGRLVAGHGRVDALEAKRKRGDKPPKRLVVDGRGEWMIPVIRGVGFKDEAEAEAYLIGDNELTTRGGWDEAGLADILNSIRESTEGLKGTGFSESELAEMEERVRQSVTNVSAHQRNLNPDSVPDLPKQAVTQPGDLWILGRHRVLCGDSTIPENVERLMAGQTASLLHADPPYGMGKEKDGVLNDNLRGEKLDAFQMAWVRAWWPHLDGNASLYVWGTAPDLWRLWYCGLNDFEQLSFRNEIVWTKGSAGAGGISHIGTEALRQYPNETERCLFFMRGEQRPGVNADDYWEGWEPLRSYLDGEREKMGWTAKDIKRICGVGMYSHWFSRSQWTMITQEHYQKLQEAAAGKAFLREYAEAESKHSTLRAAYEPLLQEFYATRAFFDNTHDLMTNVWGFPRVQGGDRYEHATPKPVEMMGRCIKSSSRDEALIVEPFLGTGTTLIAAEQLGRACYGMELEPRYCDVVLSRWQNLTGEDAVREDGTPFSELT